MLNDNCRCDPVRQRAEGRLEPCAGKLACTVLRGERAGNGAFLPDGKARNPYDGHTLDEAIEQVSIVANQRPHTVMVDKGYKGAQVDGVQILRSGQCRGVTRTMKAMIKRRSAIEPTIGHMKSDGRLNRNPLKGALGDALHAVLCGAGHNIRLLLCLLRLVAA